MKIQCTHCKNQPKEIESVLNMKIVKKDPIVLKDVFYNFKTGDYLFCNYCETITKHLKVLLPFKE